MTGRTTRLVAILCLGLAYAAPLSDIGWNQGSHYALVRAISRGSPYVDDDRWLTGDVAFADGRFFSTKAPGLALASMPAYAALRATGVADAIVRQSASRWRGARVTIWALGLAGVVVPALVLLWLVAAAGDRVERGWGLAAATTLGVGTLLLPFSTLFFSHVLSALLGFAAFFLLWRERDARRRWWIAAPAGLLLGLGVTTEYTLGLLVLPLGAYAIVGSRRPVAGGVAWAAGIAAGVVPLLLYNWWAFASPFDVSYENAVSVPGASGHDVLGANTSGFFGVGVPSPRVAGELLFASRGLFTLSPVLVMAAVGIALMPRRGRRAEALVIGAVALAFLLVNAGYFLPFGGWAAGPRFLIPALPFLAVALSSAYRRLPATTLGLAVASAVVFVTATVTEPLLPNADIGRWVAHVRSGWFRDTVPTMGFDLAPRWLTVVVFVVPLVAAITLTAMTVPRARLSRCDLTASVGLLAGWVLAASLVPRLGSAPGVGAMVLVLVAGAVAACVVVLVAWRDRRRGDRAEAGHEAAGPHESSRSKTFTSTASRSAALPPSGRIRAATPPVDVEARHVTDPRG